MSVEEDLERLKRQFNRYKDDVEAEMRKLKDELERLARRVRDLE